MVWQPEQARRFAFDHLRASAEAYDRGDLNAIDDGHDELDESMPRENLEADELFIVLEFWSGWIDSRNHDWKYYEPLNESSWAPLARRVAAALESEQPLPEEVIRHFTPRNRATQGQGCLSFFFGRTPDE